MSTTIQFELITADGSGVHRSLSRIVGILHGNLVPSWGWRMCRCSRAGPSADLRESCQLLVIMDGSIQLHAKFC